MVPYIQPLTTVSLISTCAVRNNSGSLNYDRRKVHGTVFQSPTVPKKPCEYSNVLVKVLTGNVLLLHRKLTSLLHNRIESPPGIVIPHLFSGDYYLPHHFPVTVNHVVMQCDHFEN